MATSSPNPLPYLLRFAQEVPAVVSGQVPRFAVDRTSNDWCVLRVVQDLQRLLYERLGREADRGPDRLFDLPEVRQSRRQLLGQVLLGSLVDEVRDDER